MRNVLTLTRREIGSYFVSPIAYVTTAAFLLVAGLVFVYIDLRPGSPATLEGFFLYMMFILVLILPVLAMKSLAEELGRGTIESLMTTPISDTEVVLGKFLGTYVVYLAMLAPTVVYVFVLAGVANPEIGPIVSGYIGLGLVGLMYAAVGVMASSMTRSQVISAVIAIVILAALVLVGPLVGPQVGSPWREIVIQASVLAHFMDFSRGVVSVVHIIYFVAIAAFALFLTVKILESRRWR